MMFGLRASGFVYALLFSYLVLLAAAQTTDPQEGICCKLEFFNFC